MGIIGYDSAVIVTTLKDYWWLYTVLNTVSRKYSSVYIPRIKKTADSLHKVLNASVTDINQGISISDTMKNTSIYLFTRTHF